MERADGILRIPSNMLTNSTLEARNNFLLNFKPDISDLMLIKRN